MNPSCPIAPSLLSPLCYDSLQKSLFFGKPHVWLTPAVMLLGTMNNVVEVSEKPKSPATSLTSAEIDCLSEITRQGAPAPLCERAVESLN